jgi:hypothetical protein
LLSYFATFAFCASLGNFGPYSKRSGYLIDLNRWCVGFQKYDGKMSIIAEIISCYIKLGASQLLLSSQ